MQIVNGFVCRDCTDVENARKFIDPAHPQQKLGSDGDDQPKDALAAEAVTFGGALSALAETRRDQDPAKAGSERRPVVDVTA